MLQYVSNRAVLSRSPLITIVILRLGRAKSHIVFCDTDLNTIPGVYLNAYQNFLVVAMRMHHYLRSWGANIHKNLKYIHSMSQLFSSDSFRIMMNRRIRDNTTSGSVYVCGDAQQGIEQGIYSSRG